MNEITSPSSLMFDLQRQTIESTRTTIHHSIETQQAVATMAWDTMSAMQTPDAHVDAMRAVVDSYVDVLESTLSISAALTDELRAVMHEQLTIFADTQADQIEAIDQLVADASEPGDELFEEFVGMLDERFEALLTAHEDLEAQTVETLDEFDGDLDELRGAFEDLQEQIETATATATDTATEQIDIQVDAVSESLEVIDGLGPTYAGRLHSEGIETLEALTEANANTVAEAADVSIDTAESWIDAAELSA